MIHIFGDSFSDNLWPQLLSEKTGIEHKNYSKTGETNLFILTTLIENLKNFKKGDTIIVQTSGQGRLNVRDVVIYGDQIKYGLKNHPEKGLSDSECEIVEKWYKTFYLPQICLRDPYIDSIIHLSNHLSTQYDVILWNLTSLGSNTTKKINDNVEGTPQIPFSNLWLDLSDGGKKGWVEIIHEMGLGCSEIDPHPSIDGNKFISECMFERLQNKLI